VFPAGRQKSRHRMNMSGVEWRINVESMAITQANQKKKYMPVQKRKKVKFN
jgi:hypothetical protein